MLSLLALIFVLTYAAIALEHPLGVDKSASALIGAGLLWTVYAVSTASPELVGGQLNESLASTAQIVFFLMGAMTIVEVLDAHNSFELITSRIRTARLSPLLWLVCWVAFFLSAVLDNLTTTIVMISMVKKLLDRQEDRFFFAGMIVIAANAGGAWSPLGDVTTTMLWIGGQITPLAIVRGVFLASVANLLVPLLVVSWRFKGRSVAAPPRGSTGGAPGTSILERDLVFLLGLGILVLVPVFKTATHLPPFLGILFGLGILWLVANLVHRNKPREVRARLTLAHALTRIDLDSLIFFIGILLSVAVLEHSHILTALASLLQRAIGRYDVIVSLIGILSAIVDNVPLVAAAIGMYDMAQHSPNSFLWEFLAYCAGTGGSILVIGSAAGVAAMGMEKIRFFWYAKRIGGLALVGYAGGIAVYLVQRGVLG